MKTLKIAAVAAAIMATNVAHAEVKIYAYTDVEAWNKATQSSLLEEFNNETTNGFTITPVGDGHLGFNSIQGILFDGLVPGSSTTFTFTNAITAFGANWNLQPGERGLGLQLYVDSIADPVAAISNTYAGEFFGFTSTVAFNTLTIKAGQPSEGITAEQYYVDNVRFGMAAPVPEPEAYSMLLAGLGLMGFVTKRRKNRLRA